MKIKANKSILLKELAVAAKYRTKDGISYTYFEATAEGLVIKSTDNQVYYSNILPLQIVGEEDLETVHEVIEPGVIAINSKFEEVLRKVSGDVVVIEAKNEKISIASDGFDASVATVELDFPSAPAGNEGAVIESPMDFFKNIVQRTGFAHATSDSRPALKGINLKANGETLSVVTTNSHRLASYQAASPIQFDEVTVPAKAFASVLEEFDPTEKLKMASIGTHLKFVQEERIVYVLLLDGNYPNTEKLIQLDPAIPQIKLDSKAFLNAIDRALLFAKDGPKKGVAIVHFEQVDNNIRVFSKNEEGQIDSFIPIIEQSQKLESKCSFQGNYLQEAIRAHNQKDVLVHVLDNTRPLYITSEAIGVIQLVLPIRVS